MKVKATKVGWCGFKLRKVGEVFDYQVNDDKSNLGSWMEPIKEDLHKPVEDPSLVKTGNKKQAVKEAEKKQSSTRSLKTK